MPTDLCIRDFEPRDLEAVQALNMHATEPDADIAASLWHYPDLLDIPASFQRDGAFLVGTVRDELVAMGSIHPGEDRAFEVNYIRVAIPYHRHGFGRALMFALEERAMGLGATATFLDTTPQQVPAQRLYESIGYQESHRSVVHNIDGARFDVIHYRKELPGKN